MDLDDLYEAVPAAQEEDLLDELVHERQQAALRRWLGDDEPEPVDATAGEADEPPLRPGQVLGLLEHQLGAVVLPDDEGGSPSKID